MEVLNSLNDFYYKAYDMSLDDQPYGVAIPQRVDKKWGYENIIINTEKYCMKELVIKSLQSTSIHFHIRKHETLHVTSGELIVNIYNAYNQDKKVVLHEGSSYIIIPGLVHRLEAGNEGCILIEASTYSQDTDSIRL